MGELGERISCRDCDGTGWVAGPDSHGNGCPCPKCNRECRYCDGNGTVPNPEYIPPYVVLNPRIL